MSSLLSICIPTFNRSEFLQKAISSVLAQSYNDFELVIVDNASTDDTQKVVALFKDNRIRYFRNNENLGLGLNWNQCISLANGEFICIFHDDDLMLPENLKMKMEYFSKNPSLRLIHSNVNRIDAADKVIGKHWAKRHKENYYSRAGKELFMQLLLEDSPICSPSVIVRKEVFNKVGLFNPKLSYACDWEMWLRVTFYYDSAYIAQTLVNYRCHKDMLTQKYLRTNGLEQIYQAKKNVLIDYLKYLKNADNLLIEVKKSFRKRGLKLFMRYLLRGWFFEAMRSLKFVFMV